MQRGFSVTFGWVLPVPGTQDTPVKLLEGTDIITFTAHPGVFTKQGLHSTQIAPKIPETSPKQPAELLGRQAAAKPAARLRCQRRERRGS